MAEWVSSTPWMHTGKQISSGHKAVLVAVASQHHDIRKHRPVTFYLAFKVANAMQPKTGCQQSQQPREVLNLCTLGSPVVPLVYMMVHRSPPWGGTADAGFARP